MKCVKCGEEIGEARACRWCGTMQPEGGTRESEEVAAKADEQDKDREENTATEKNDEEDAATAEKNGGGEDDVADEARSTEKNEGGQADGSSDIAERKRVGRGRKLVIVNGCIAAVLLAFIAFTLATAERWEKVDVPEHEDLSSAREVPTGKYIVTMDNVNPCYVGQDWTECINAHIAQYNAACTLPLSKRFVLVRDESGYHLASDGSHSEARAITRTAMKVTEHLTSKYSSQELCQDYSNMISKMQDEDRPGYYVASLGSWGQLTATPETETIYDIIPAQTHEAVCYLGFIGECREDEATEGN